MGELATTVPTEANGERRVGLAIQGGGFPAGAFAAGVVKALVECGAFEKYDIRAFSGTSAGALVAAVCWANRMKGTIDRIPGDLDRQWHYFTFPNHGAWMPMWTPAIAEWWRSFDAQCMQNRMWLAFVQNCRTPFFRWMMQHWITETIAIDEIQDLMRKQAKHRVERVGLVLGSADVLRGEIRSFREDEFSLSALMASGSLDDMNGMTTIVTPPHAGTYLDGAWGQNPPISELMDYRLDEIWLIEHFPREIDSVPATPAERRERRDELWQNSLVEHEMEVVELVNQWREAINQAIMAEIATLREQGKLPTKDELRRLHDQLGELPKDLDRLLDEANDFEPKEYKKVEVKRIRMCIPRELGATVVNSPFFIDNLMRQGEAQARAFADRGYSETPEAPRGLLPAWWAWMPAPVGDILVGARGFGHDTANVVLGMLDMAAMPVRAMMAPLSLR